MSVSVPPLGRLGPEDPRRVGRFRCVGVLGAGGMGRVLLAFGPDGRAVAVKIVHPHLADVHGDIGIGLQTMVAMDAGA